MKRTIKVGNQSCEIDFGTNLEDLAKFPVVGTVEEGFSLAVRDLVSNIQNGVRPDVLAGGKLADLATKYLNSPKGSGGGQGIGMKLLKAQRCLCRDCKLHPAEFTKWGDLVFKKQDLDGANTYLLEVAKQFGYIE